MAGFTLGKWIKPPLERAAARLGALGAGSLVTIGAGFVIGLAALPAIVTGRFWLGLVLMLLSRAIAAVGGVNAGVQEADLAAAFEMIFLAGMPFAFALNEPDSALSAGLLLFGLIAAGTASRFANAALARSDAALCIAAFAVACLRPDWFALIAYVLSVFCFIAAGVRIALAFTRSDA